MTYCWLIIMSSRVLGLTGLAARRRSVAIVQRRFQSSSTNSEHFSQAARMTAAARYFLANNKRAVYAATGSTVVLALFGLTRNGSNYVDDPRDVRALSTVPFVTLCSGWM
jgi:hypothetical protein